MKPGLVLILVMMALNLSAEDAVEPPCSASEYDHFDFWVGRWISYSNEGEKQGTNHLVELMGNCVLQENWSSGGGKFRGTSYNFYNKGTKKWHQTWVDTTGASLNLTGELIDGSMQLSGSRTNEKGETVIDRITWSPLEDGRVRQHWEASSDDGVSWAEVFDGYYVKDVELH